MEFSTLVNQTVAVNQVLPYNEQALVEHLLDGYNPAIRPVKNITTTTVLFLTLHLIAIEEIVSIVYFDWFFQLILTQKVFRVKPSKFSGLIFGYSW